MRTSLPDAIGRRRHRRGLDRPSSTVIIEDIEKLDRQASALAPEFFTVFPRTTPEQKRLFELLKSAYIDARYKRDFVITRGELDYLASRVRKLQELTKRICEEKIASMA
ncbi:MAG: hypothetical protein ABFD16_12655 [Thermoguttaceae bacterium]